MDFKKLSRLILIEQTLFTLPFAYLGILFAGMASISVWILVTIALTAARTAGMSFNRVIDADIDAKNPRTKNRAVPRGEVSRKSVWILAVISSLILIAVSFMLNMLCFYLSFIALILLFTYSFFKRFSVSTHFYLGFVEAAAPIGGYIAVTGKFSLLPFVLGLAILAWIAGLDIVYALQDMDFDRSESLYSLPSALGRGKALVISAFCYVVSLTALTYTGVTSGRRLPFWISCVCVTLIFFYQQYLGRKSDTEGAIQRFFKVNMAIAPLLFIGTFIDVYFF